MRVGQPKFSGKERQFNPEETQISYLGNFGEDIRG
jgi:hypothetical protein